MLWQCGIYSESEPQTPQEAQINPARPAVPGIDLLMGSFINTMALSGALPVVTTELNFDLRV